MSKEYSAGNDQANQNGNGLYNGNGTLALLNKTAHDALATGINPLPPEENGKKKPLTIRVNGESTWKPFQEELVTPDQVDRWYGCRTGLGFVCGAVSRGLELLDFDHRETYERFKELAIEAGHGELVEKIEAGYLEDTPGDGVHWFYFCDEVRESGKLARRYKTPDEFNDSDRKAIEAAREKGREHRPVKTLIETKGEHGYAVVSPSFGKVHPSGNPYRLLRGGVETIVTLTSAERDTLWSLARMFDRMPTAESPSGNAKSRRRDESTTGGAGAADVSVIDDYNARSTWRENLPGWTLTKEKGETEYWTREGKDPRDGHSATVNHDGSGRFYCFSSSTAFTTLKPYSKFDAYALLNHGGNVRDAVKALRQVGYGTHRRWVWNGDDYEVRTCQNPLPEGAEIATPFNKPRTQPAGAEPPPDEPSSDARPAPPGLRPLTDMGNSERLVDRHGARIRYCWPWASWYHWDERRWVEDRSGHVEHLGKVTIRGIAAEGVSVEDKDDRKAVLRWAIASESKKRLDAMISKARSEPGIAVVPEQFNNDPWLLNVLNGTVDLRTGLLQRHHREDLITKLAPVEFDYEATCPRWVQFEKEIFAGDEELIAYMRRAVGYSLTGIDRLQELNILYGEGSNGKNVYLDTIRGILGDYACQAPASLLLSKQTDDHPTAIADMDGRRFVTASETEAERRLAESLVKNLTGDDTIKARKMRQDFYEFKRTFKLFLATNHKPQIRGTDHGIWRRIRMVPFKVKFVKNGDAIKPPDVLPEVEGLREELVAERSGILRLLVRGCLDWQRHGMNPPESVMAATADYRKEMDVLADFIADRCVVLDGVYVKASVLYKAYSTWCEEGNVKPVLSIRPFGQEMERRGFHVEHTKTGNLRYGIGLRPEGTKVKDSEG